MTGHAGVARLVHDDGVARCLAAVGGIERGDVALGQGDSGLQRGAELPLGENII